MDKRFFNKIGKGKITISRVSCNQREEDYVRIVVEDELSSVTFLEVDMDLKSFANCITGFSYQPVEFGVRGFDRIGKKLESKTEHVPLSWNPTEEEIEQALSAFEVDGWIGRRSDCKNSRRRVQKGEEGAYSVTFHRWVEIEENEEDAVL
jgi:hypothetical protein